MSFEKLVETMVRADLDRLNAGTGTISTRARGI